MTRSAQDIIDDMRNIVKPGIAKMLFGVNFEGCGKEDKAEFETEFEMLLTLAEMALKQGQKWDRLYSWLNDMRFGIAPDETVTDIDERNVRTAQVDLLDEIMEWIDESQEGEDKE